MRKRVNQYNGSHNHKNSNKGCKQFISHTIFVLIWFLFYRSSRRSRASAVRHLSLRDVGTVGGGDDKEMRQKRTSAGQDNTAIQKVGNQFRRRLLDCGFVSRDD